MPLPSNLYSKPNNKPETVFKPSPALTQKYLTDKIHRQRNAVLICEAMIAALRYRLMECGVPWSESKRILREVNSRHADSGYHAKET